MLKVPILKLPSSILEQLKIILHTILPKKVLRKVPSAPMMMQRCIPLYLLLHSMKYALVPIGYDANLPARPNHMYLD